MSVNQRISLGDVQSMDESGCPGLMLASKFKRSMRVELAVDALEIANQVDNIMLFSGDGDFCSLLEAAQRRGVHVTVISSLRSKPPMIAETPNGYFHRPRRSKGSHWSNVERCSAAGRVSLVRYGPSGKPGGAPAACARGPLWVLASV